MAVLSIVYAIVGFGILVFFHELGHFIAAKSTGIGVDEFALGFGRGIVKYKYKGVLYKIGWIPLGGYCKMKGQSDFGKPDIEHAPDEFYERPRWARFITVAAGPIFSFIIGIVLSVIVIWIEGKDEITSLSIGEIPESYDVDFQPGDKILEIEGIEVNSANDIMMIMLEQPSWKDSYTITVLRNGSEVEVDYPYTSYDEIINKPMEQLIRPDTENLIINSVSSGTPADEAGLKVNDIITKINNFEITSIQQMINIINNTNLELVKIERNGIQQELYIDADVLTNLFGQDYQVWWNTKNAFQRSDDYITWQDSFAGEQPAVINESFLAAIDERNLDIPLLPGDIITEINTEPITQETVFDIINGQEYYYKTPVKVEYSSNGNDRSIMIEPRKVDSPYQDHGMRGIRQIGVMASHHRIEHVDYGFFQGIAAGWNKSVDFIQLTFHGLVRLFSGEMPFKDNVAGPVVMFGMIGKVGAEEGFVKWLDIVAIISLLLGFFNILPIPALDGGHLLITSIEAIRRKNFKIETIQRVQTIGFAVLMSLALVVIIKDFIYWPSFLGG